MANLADLTADVRNDGYSQINAEAKVCQDINSNIRFAKVWHKVPCYYSSFRICGIFFLPKSTLSPPLTTMQGTLITLYLSFMPAKWFRS